MSSPFATPKTCALEFLPTISFLNRVGAFMGNEKQTITNQVCDAAKDPTNWVMVRESLVEIQKKRQVVSDLVRNSIADAIDQANQYCENLI